MVWPRHAPSEPAAVVWVLRAQVGVVYVMAGLGKLNTDWLLRGEPMRTPPDWPDRVLCRHKRPRTSSLPTQNAPPPSRRRWLPVALLAWAVLQVAVPLRHLAYAGDVRWTEEGYYGSFRGDAHREDRMAALPGQRSCDGRVVGRDPGDVLEPWQVEQAASRADLVLAAAHVVRDTAEGHGHEAVEVRADSFMLFNGRPSQRMIDPAVDLAALPRSARAAKYVLPLDPPIFD